MICKDKRANIKELQYRITAKLSVDFCLLNQINFTFKTVFIIVISN